jgi:hypothetical protein
LLFVAQDEPEPHAQYQPPRTNERGKHWDYVDRVAALVRSGMSYREAMDAILEQGEAMTQQAFFDELAKVDKKLSAIGKQVVALGETLQKLTSRLSFQSACTNKVSTRHWKFAIRT